tara:strand:- start:924 stop:1682 length:759 start_codon:yes stop_codon:yes gene_type:complete
MRAKHLGDLLIDYVNWRSRFVGTRPRIVEIKTDARESPAWTKHANLIDAFLRKAREGEDLTPHLSFSAYTRGYTPVSRKQGANSEERWSDKDFILNTMNFHHFHLGQIDEETGTADRTNTLIFALVSRETFEVVATFDHTVFDNGTEERARLFAVHDQILTRGTAPGSVVIGSMITLSGHWMPAVRYAQECTRIVRELDPYLDDREKLNELLVGTGPQPPHNAKWEWAFNHLDLGFLEKRSREFFVLKKGWN